MKVMEALETVIGASNTSARLSETVAPLPQGAHDLGLIQCNGGFHALLGVSAVDLKQGGSVLFQYFFDLHTAVTEGILRNGLGTGQDSPVAKRSQQYL